MRSIWGDGNRDRYRDCHRDRFKKGSRSTEPPYCLVKCGNRAESAMQHCSCCLISSSHFSNLLHMWQSCQWIPAPLFVGPKQLNSKSSMPSPFLLPPTGVPASNGRRQHLRRCDQCGKIHPGVHMQGSWIVGAHAQRDAPLLPQWPLQLHLLRHGLSGGESIVIVTRSEPHCSPYSSIYNCSSTCRLA